VVFRLIWGVVGSETALFARFVDGPGAVAAYVRGAAPPRWGHNPLAGWAVLALLAGVGWTLATGLAIPAGPDEAAASVAAPAFADDDEREEAGEAEESAAAERHEAAFDLLSALVMLHVVAVFAYPFWRGENLLGPMLGAGKPAGEGAPPDAALKAPRAALPAAGAAALIALVLFGFDVA
jgi:cytochrome b